MSIMVFSLEQTATALCSDNPSILDSPNERASPDQLESSERSPCVNANSALSPSWCTSMYNLFLEDDTCATNFKAKEIKSFCKDYEV